MPSSLRDANISDTYIGVLHAGGQQLLSNGQSAIYDGYGNASALMLGVSGKGISVTGTSTFELVQTTGVEADVMVVTTSIDCPNTTKAWALIQGNGMISSQYNIGAVTKNSTGDYTVYFLNQLPTADYTVNITVTHDNTANKVLCAYVKSTPAPTASNFSFRTDFLNTGTTTAPFTPTSISITVNHL